MNWQKTTNNSSWQPEQYHLTAYPVPEGSREPFALILPGGGYEHLADHEGEPIAKKLNEKGISAFVLRYSIGEHARYPAPLLDVVSALRHIFANAESLPIQTEDYSVWGFSAGGHLCGLTAAYYKQYHLPKPGAVVLCYPVVTMGEWTHQGSRKNLLGKHPSEEEVRETSIERLADKDFPPAYLWHSAQDRGVDPENSRQLARALTEHGVKHRYHEFPSGGHGVGLGLGTSCEPWFDEAVAFWRKDDEA